MSLLNNWLRRANPNVGNPGVSNNVQTENVVAENPPQNVVDLTESKPSKKRCIRNFQPEWEESFFFIEVKGHPVCLICNESVWYNHKASVRRHHEQCHPEIIVEFPPGSVTRKEHIIKLKVERQYSQQIIKKAVSFNESITMASYILAWRLANDRKPYTYGDDFLTTLTEMAPFLFATIKDLDKVLECIENLQAKKDTMNRRVSAIADQFKEKVMNGVKECVAWSVALDSSSDIKDFEHLVVWVNYSVIVEDRVKVFRKYLSDLTLPLAQISFKHL